MFARPLLLVLPTLAAVVFATACGSCGTRRADPAKRTCSLIRDAAHHAPPILDLSDGKPVDPAAVLDLRVHLGLRDSEGLDRLLLDLYDPVAPQHLQFLTRREFAARFHPGPAEIGRARAHLEKHGLKVSAQPQGAVLRVQGRVDQAQAAFDVRLRHFVSAVSGDRMRAAEGAIATEGLPRIVAVHGLSSAAGRVSHLRRGPRVAGQGAARAPSGLSAADIRRAYSIPSTLTAPGATIGFVQLDGFLDSDLDAYASANGLRRVPTRRVRIGEADMAPQTPGGQAEATLDLELANALAPDAKEFVVYTAANTPVAWHDMLNEIANPSDPNAELVRYISCSWGTPEDQMSSADVLAEHDLFRQMACQGQFFAAASGDSGDKADGQHVGTDDPASSPWVLAVGGTSLSLNPLRTRAGETAWSGSGGGVSCYWPNPSWQDVRVGDPYIDDGRNVPDVAMHADANGPSGSYVVIVNGRPMVVGGTSCAAPLWTALAAGVGVQRAKAGMPALGAWGPYVHRLGMSSKSAEAFFHIDQGDNGTYKSLPTTDYDNVCGWGSPNGVYFSK